MHQVGSESVLGTQLNTGVTVLEPQTNLSLKRAFFSKSSVKNFLLKIVTSG